MDLGEQTLEEQINVERIAQFTKEFSEVYEKKSGKSIYSTAKKYKRISFFGGMGAAIAIPCLTYVFLSIFTDLPYPTKFDYAFASGTTLGILGMMAASFIPDTFYKDHVEKIMGEDLSRLVKKYSDKI